MDILWQQITVGAIVMVAIGYLVYRWTVSRRKKRACKDCALMKAISNETLTGNTDSRQHTSPE